MVMRPVEAEVCMVRELSVVEGDSYPLRETCERIVQFDATVSALIDDLVQTMKSRHVLSLSAPQLGIPRQVVVVDVGQGVVELVNPIVLHSDGRQKGVESCASFPDLALEVERPGFLTVEAQDRTGATIHLESSGLLARIVGHELDHLQGVLFYDHLEEDDFFLQIFDQCGGGTMDPEENPTHAPLKASEQSELDAARLQEKTQVVDMIADASWKLSLSVELLEEDDTVTNSPELTELRALAEQLRDAVDDWEARLIGHD